MIARKSSRTSFTFGTCLHRPLHLGFCGASALFIRVHRALEHYQSYGNADKTEVLALHVALVHFQLCSTLRAVETRRSLSISSHLVYIYIYIQLQTTNFDIIFCVSEIVKFGYDGYFTENSGTVPAYQDIHEWDLTCFMKVPSGNST